MEFWTGSIGLSKVRAMPRSLADSYDEYVDGAKAAEQLGFDGYGAPEHHFMYDGFMPAPLHALSAAAAATKSIKLVTGAMLLPLYDPCDAASQAATLDVVSGGRLVLGLGMGYRPLEFAGLGFEKRTRGARLVEAMHVIEAATSGEHFSFEGTHYSFENVRLEPTPLQHPIPAWFCGGTSVKAARRAGEAGLAYWLANSPIDQVRVIIDEYRRAGFASGHGPKRLRVAAFKDVCIGSTVEEAERFRQGLIDTFYEEHILGYGYLVDDDGNHVYNPPRDHPMYQRFVDGIFCGTTDDVIEELKRYEEVGVEVLFLASMQRELIAEKIIPAFR